MTTRNLPQEFDRLGQRLRTIGIAEMSIVVGRTLVMALSVCIALDALVRFPSFMRTAELIGLAAFGVWLARRRLLPAFDPPKSRVRLALEVERSHPQAQGRLASGVEFASDRALSASPFARRVERAAGDLVTPSAIAGILKTTQLKREVGALAIILALWVGFAVASPSLATTGLRRIITPWAAVEWPARTGVRSTTFVTHHPKQTALALKADLFHGDPEVDPVWIRLREIDGGVPGPWEKMPLIHQGETRFERLFDPQQEAIEFQFLTQDVETSFQRIDFVDAPALESLIATIIPPKYTATLQPETYDLKGGTHNQGRIAQPVLQGSSVVLEMKPTKRIVVPQTDVARADWIRSTFLWKSQMREDAAVEPQFGFTVADGVWRMSWVADRSRTLSVQLKDEYGVQNVEEIECTVDVVPDRPPEALVVEPSVDETVLPTAKLFIRGSGRDDVGLERITLEATRSPDWKREIAEVDPDGARDAVASGLLDLTTALAQPGEVFEVVLVAQDALVTGEGQARVTRSTPRKFRVLTVAQFDEETRNALTAIRQGSIRTNERQKNLIDRDEAPAAQVRHQTEISERLTTIQRMMGSLQDRLDRNQVFDDAMQSLIDAAADILQAAHTQSESARDNLQAAAQAKSEHQGDPKSEQQQLDARKAQSEVREELNDLAELLNRDKDAWVAVRALERVAEAITQSDLDRAKASEGTIGMERDELSAEESAKIEHAAQSAKDAAQFARDALEELKSRAEAVQKDDPARAANLLEAVQRGGSESLSAHLDQAEQATRQNQMDQAQQASASAMKTVTQMIEDLADDEQARTERLRRRLASLAEALEQLLREAESTEDLGLALLTADGEIVTKSAPGLSQQAGRLSLNASGVADEGRAADPSTQRVVRLVDRGAEAEGRAAGAFAKVNPEVALGHENLVRGSALFREALEAVREQEQRQAEQERRARARELAEAYRALVDQQEGILTATQAIVASQENRRALVESRRLGVSQEVIRKEISRIHSGSEDVQKSPTFCEATALALDAAARAAEELRTGSPTASTIEFEREVLETLRGLAGALAESAKKKDDPFDDPVESAGGGGGAGGGGQPEEPLIPPLAELKVLRSLQQRIYERTKKADGVNPPSDTLSTLAQRQDAIAKIAETLRQEVERQMRERENQSAPRIVPPGEAP